MIKRFVLSTLLVLGVLINSNSQDASVGEGDDSCQTGGLANVNCPYWDVEYEVSSGFWPWSAPNIKVTCTTGGSFMCEKP